MEADLGEFLTQSQTRLDSFDLNRLLALPLCHRNQLTPVVSTSEIFLFKFTLSDYRYSPGCPSLTDSEVKRKVEAMVTALLVSDQRSGGVCVVTRTRYNNGPAKATTTNNDKRRDARTAATNASNAMIASPR